jgi:DNA primase
MARPDWIDYRKVKDAVSIESVLERIGHPFARKPGGGLESTCPVHGGHNPRQFKVTPSLRGFHCFGKDCRAHGNVIDLVAALEGLPFREAATKLARDFAIREALTRETVPTGHPRRKKAAQGAAHARRP